MMKRSATKILTTYNKQEYIMGLPMPDCYNRKILHTDDNDNDADDAKVITNSLTFFFILFFFKTKTTTTKNRQANNQ